MKQWPENITSKPIAYIENKDTYTLQAETLISMLTRLRGKQKQSIIFLDINNNESRATANEIKTEATFIAQYLKRQGLEKNDKVIIMLPTSFDFVRSFFGVLMAGGVPVPIAPPFGSKGIENYLNNLEHIVADCEARFLITFDQIKMFVNDSIKISKLLQEILFINEMTKKTVPADEFQVLPEIKAEDLALIQYTSGTTGKPKGVMLTHRNLLHNIHGIGVAARVTENDIGLSWLPLYHDMGLIGSLLGSLYWDFILIAMVPEAFLLNPSLWLENMTKYQVTISPAPNFAYNYCVSRIPDNKLTNIDLSNWRLAFNAAEPIDSKTLQRFIEKFSSCGLKNDTVFFPGYGMAENSLAATFVPISRETTIVQYFKRDGIESRNVAVAATNTAEDNAVSLVSVGYPLVGQAVQIVDEKGKIRCEGEIGEILVKSPSLFIGYYRNQEETENAFVDGWLRTGDLGFIHGRMLFVNGRRKEMIIKQGRNIYPYDMERIAASVEGIRKGCVAAFGVQNYMSGTEDLILLCETPLSDSTTKEELVRKVRAAIWENLRIVPDDVNLIPKGAIPKTSSGKIQRSLCRKMYIDLNKELRAEI